MSLIPFKSSSWNILILSSIFLFLITACQKDPNFNLAEETVVVVETTPSPKAYPGVDKALWPYFERFEKIAAAQKVPIDLVNAQLTGAVEDLAEEFVAGQCNYFSHSPNHIIVDSEFWSRASDNFKEMIVFHELGHCVLDRDHREGQLDNGYCLSIMRSGEQPCRDVYNDLTKAYYQEELFHPQRVD